MTNPILNWLRKRELKSVLAPLQAQVARIVAKGPQVSSLTDDALRAVIHTMREEASKPGFKRDEALEMLFAVVNEMAKRVLQVTPFETQLLAGLALYRGAIVEMGTGEGKTLTAPFAACAQWVLHGRQVHVCTANEYLAQRDASMMFGLYKALGMSVAVTLSSQDRAEKPIVYGMDVVYGTHQVLAQDYLSDKLSRYRQQVAMPRQFGAVIVDEADAALIDEARMPVVLTANHPANQALYRHLQEIATSLKRAQDADGEGDFWIDGKDRVAVLTERGYEIVEREFYARGLLAADVAVYGEEHNSMLLKMTSALAARNLLFKDQHYVVQDGAVVLIDQATGRLQHGRRWEGGLHQALEAKEGLPVSAETVTLARITLQHYFRQYQVLSGMTGTALDDSAELAEVYGVGVVAIPPNKPSQRIDEPERFYRTQAAKLDAVIEDIASAHAKGQPVLVGTASVEQSDTLSRTLTEMGLPHNVLSAREHAREAEIIACAGAPGAITVSTNMAGRGVDIVLGGSIHLDLFKLQQALGQEAWEALSDEQRQAHLDAIKTTHAYQADLVRKTGGLRVIGLERYESRRQDRQLRGRSARQGDPGESVFYLSLEDRLVEDFAGERIRGIFAMLDIEQGDEFEFALVQKAIEGAQREVEGRSQAARKALMDFEGVLDSQRKVIYAMRDELMYAERIDEILERLVIERAKQLVDEFLPDEDFEETWNLKGLRAELKALGLELPQTDAELVELGYDAVQGQVEALMATRRQLRLEQVEDFQREEVQRYLALDVMDRQWMHHLDAIDDLRRGIYLRGHAKLDPKQAFAKEAFELFAHLTASIRREQVRAGLTWQVAEASAPAEAADVAEVEAANEVAA